MSRKRSGDITPGEIRVLDQLVLDGPNNPEIAERLEISDKTIKTHMSNLMAKTRTHSRTELALWYVGWIKDKEAPDSVREMVQMIDPDDEREAS